MLCELSECIHLYRNHQKQRFWVNRFSVPGPQLVPVNHQLVSLADNYREASQGRSKAEFGAKLGDCLKEIEETSYWLELLIEGTILPKNKLSGLLQESKELRAIFIAIIKNTKSNSKKK